MKKLILIGLIALSSTACAVTKQPNSFVGTFNGSELNYGKTKILSINKNGTFDLTWYYIDYTGKWEVFDKDHIMLKFDELADPFLQVASGVIRAKEMKVRFATKNKVDFWDYRNPKKRYLRRVPYTL